MNKKIITLSIATMLTLPLVVLAFNYPDFTQGKNIDSIMIIDKLFAFIWPIFLAFAVIMFIVAGGLFLAGRGDASKIKDARSAVIWGVVGVVVALLAFSIPIILKNAIGV